MSKNNDLIVDKDTDYDSDFDLDHKSEENTTFDLVYCSLKSGNPWPANLTPELVAESVMNSLQIDINPHQPNGAGNIRWPFICAKADVSSLIDPENEIYLKGHDLSFHSEAVGIKSDMVSISFKSRNGGPIPDTITPEKVSAVVKSREDSAIIFFSQRTASNELRFLCEISVVNKLKSTCAFIKVMKFELMLYVSDHIDIPVPPDSATASMPPEPPVSVSSVDEISRENQILGSLRELHEIPVTGIQSEDKLPFADHLLESAALHFSYEYRLV